MPRCNSGGWLVAVGVLKPRLGRRWSPLWAEVGFVNGKLAVPTKIADRLGLLTAIRCNSTRIPRMSRIK